MSTNGKITHCEAFFFAGQRKATKGKAGLSAPVFEFDRTSSLLA